MLQLLTTIDNSMALITLLLDAICLLQSKYVVLHFWINDKCKVSNHGETIYTKHTLHIINTNSFFLFYVGQDITRIGKQKYQGWTIEEEALLLTLINENKDMSNVNIANLFYAQISQTHAIRLKICRIAQKNNNTKKQKSSPKETYMCQIEDTPIISCSICNRLMFMKSLKKCKDDESNNLSICQICYKYREHKTLSRFATLASKNFNDPIALVDSLNHIEARLISIRIPFTQIRQLSYNGQLGLRGTIVNVMADLDRAQTSLPRFCDLESTVLVGIKRKLAYSHTYLAGMVRPLLTICALKRPF